MLLDVLGWVLIGGGWLFLAAVVFTGGRPYPAFWWRLAARKLRRRID